MNKRMRGRGRHNWAVRHVRDEVSHSGRAEGAKEIREGEIDGQPGDWLHGGRRRRMCYSCYVCMYKMTDMEIAAEWARLERVRFREVSSFSA